MKETAKKIYELCDAFKAESTKAIGGNKAAGARARKISLEIEKLTKEFRKASIEEEKK